MGKAELHVDIDAELLEEARKRGVELDAATEYGIRAALAEARRLAQPEANTDAEARARQWAEENAEAIRVHNARIAERGVFGEDLRRW